MDEGSQVIGPIQIRLNLFGLSSGKDSTRLIGWAVYESGYPKESLIFTFCDTENEYPEVYQQIDDIDAWLAARNLPKVIRLRAQGSWVDKYWMFPVFLALCIWKGRFPAAKTRFCTDFLKIRPTEDFIRSLQLQGYQIVSHSGVRASESTERSMMAEYATDLFGCTVRRPLLKETLSDVWQGHHKYGLPINKLYRLGWKRVGCRLCIMSNKEDVRRTASKRPWVIGIYRSWELIVGAYRKARGSITDYSSWFHRKTVPLAHRSKLIQTKKNGKQLVCTIGDVAAWSKTAWGGKQHLLPLEEESYEIDDAHAPCKSGFCE